MKSAPLFLASSTALRPSSGDESATEFGHIGLGPSRTWLAMTMRGPTSFFSSKASRISKWKRAIPGVIGGLPHITRTPVTPLATKSFPDTGYAKWTCMSQRPGMTYLPARSTRRAGGEEGIALFATTATIRTPSTRTARSGSSVPFTTSITVTLTRANRVLGRETSAGTEPAATGECAGGDVGAAADGAAHADNTMATSGVG